MTTRRARTVAWHALLNPETQRLERPVVDAGWAVPDVVELDEEADRLVIRGVPGRRRVRPAAGLLERFKDLGRAPPEKIRDYARRSGVLEICAHGLPTSHNKPRPNPDGEGVLSFGCIPLLVDQDPRTLWEPVSVWRRLAGEAHAIVNLAARLREGTVGKPEDWAAIRDAPIVAVALHSVQGGHLPEAGTAAEWRSLAQQSLLGKSPAFEQEMLAEIVNQWLRWGDVRPSLGWKGDRPRVRLGGDGLFGALAVQLMLAVNAGKGVATCTECGQVYAPKRLPNPNRENFCLDCGRKIALRRAQRRRRERQAAEATGTRACGPREGGDNER